MFGSAPFGSAPFGTGGDSSPPAQTGQAILPITIDIVEHTGRAALPITIQVVKLGRAVLPITIEVFGRGQAVLPITISIYNAAALTAATLRWRAVVTVAGSDLSDRVTGPIMVDREESAAGIAEFSLLPTAWAISPASWVGKPVSIHFATVGSGGAPENQIPLFTGLVDVPEFDVASRIVSLRCTDDLQGKCARLGRDALAALIGGYWSAAVFDAKADNWQYAQDRASTIPAALDCTPSGGLRLTAWEPKSTADQQVDTTRILDETLAVDLASHAEIKNRIRVNFTYRFPRYKKRMVSVGWNGIDNLGQIMMMGLPVATREMVLQAIKGTGWELVGEPGWVPVPAGPIEVNLGDGKYGYWVTTEQNLGSMTSSGQKTLPTNPVAVSSTSAADKLCFGFVARLYKRYTQSIDEAYGLVVENSQSIAKIGPLEEIDSGGLSVDADTSAWESWRSPGLPANAVVFGATKAQETEPLLDFPAALSGETSQDYVPDAESDRNAAESAMRTLIARAQARIWASHRRNVVRLTVPIEPRADLDWTLRVATTPITAKGKLRRVMHRLDIEAGSATTDLEVAICALDGTGIIHPQDSPDPPAAPAAAGPSATATFGVSNSNFIGKRLGAPVFDPETMIGFSCNISNQLHPEYDGSAPEYPVQFSVRAPEIEAASRDNLTVPIAETYAARIVEDEFISA